jgi:hypothetical protein
MPIRIRSKVKVGFWRCGVHHPSEWVEHPDDLFSKEQLKVLKAEPMLEIEVTSPESNVASPGSPDETQDPRRDTRDTGGGRRPK